MVVFIDGLNEESEFFFLGNAILLSKYFDVVFSLRIHFGILYLNFMANIIFSFRFKSAGLFISDKKNYSPLF